MTRESGTGRRRTDPDDLPPHVRIYNSQIPGKYKKLLNVMLSFNNKRGLEIYPSNHEVARRLSLTGKFSEQVVRRGLSYCRREGWITLLRQGGGRAPASEWYTGLTNYWEITPQNLRNISLWLRPASADHSRPRSLKVFLDDSGGIDVQKLGPNGLLKLLDALSQGSTSVPGIRVVLHEIEAVRAYAKESTRVPKEPGTRVLPNEPGTSVPPNLKVSSELEVKGLPGAIANE